MTPLLLMLLATPSTDWPPISYPEAAAERGEQGSVTADFDVDGAGLVKNCQVGWSSKSPALDESVCPALIAQSAGAASRAKHRHRMSRHISETFHFILFDVPFSKNFLMMGDRDEIILSERHPSPDRAVKPAMLLSDPSPIYPSDYPRGSGVMGEQGMVVAAYRIGSDGLIAACRIIGSSGSKRLDEATCTLMMKRMKFSPATDAADKPLSSLSVRKVIWRNPQYQIGNTPRSEF